MKKTTQILFLLAVVAVLLIVGRAVLKQPPREWTAPQVEFSEKLKNIEDTKYTKIEESQTGKEEASLGDQRDNEEKVEGLFETNWQWVNQQKKLYNLTEDEVDQILLETQERLPDETDKLKALSILRLGTPYQLGCLGEEGGRDKDPIFRLDVTDCTAFVLTNVALLHSQTTEEARAMMRYLNYQSNSEMTFENRLHFTVDRNVVSPYFQDITGEVASGRSLKTVKVTLNKIKTNGERLININWEKEMVFGYIPSKYVTKTLLQGLPKTVGIAFIKKGDEQIGLDVRHEGFLFDGKLLFHASSVQKKVVSENFLKYYFNKDNNSRFDGILLFQIN